MKKNRPIKITFVLPTMQAGGAERVVSFVASNINKEKFNVELIVTGKKQQDSYELDNLKIIYLNKKKVRFAVLSLVFHFARNRSEIIFSSLSHLNKAVSFISILFPNKTLVARETYIRPVNADDKAMKPNTIHKYIEAYSFKLFDYIICQSNDMFENTKSTFNLSDKKIKIIRNPITDNFKLKNEIVKNNVNSYSFITVGRLSKEKGHLRLLEVLKKFDKTYIYTIIGEGPLKDEIFEKANTLGILDKINYIPFTKNVSEYLSKVDCFLQGSYTEGFPNALLESCAVGTPAIAFDVPGGTKEIIENGINGFMVNTEDEFLLRLNNLPNLNPKSVSESVYRKFGKDIILGQYEQFFMEIAKKN